MENSFVKDKGRLSFFNWGKSSGMVRIAVLTALMAVMILGMTAVAFGADMENQGDGQEDGVQVLETVYVEGDGLQDGGFNTYYPPEKLDGNNNDINYSMGIDGVPLETYQALENILCKEWRTQSSKIDVSSLGIRIEDIKDLYFAVRDDHPEYFYIGNGLGYNYNNGIVASVQPSYYEYTMEEIEAFNEKVNIILSNILEQEMSELEMALAIHEYIVLNCQYGDLNNDKISYYSAYGVFMEKEAVCQGYAMAFALLLDKVGIDNKYITSPYIFKLDINGEPVLDDNNQPIIIGGMGHAWNAVELNGNWYHVDVTWDDPTWGWTDSNVEYGTLGSEGYSNKAYFLVSADTLAKDHVDWLPESSYNYNDKRFETGYAFNGIESPMYYNDGYFYYLDKPESENAPSKLVKSKIQGAADEIGAHSVWSSFLQFDGSDFYFNSDNGANYIIQSFDINTKHTEEIASGLISPYYGLSLDNGRLTWVPEDLQNEGTSQTENVESHGFVYSFGSPIYETNHLVKVGDLKNYNECVVQIKKNFGQDKTLKVLIADYNNNNKMINFQEKSFNLTKSELLVSLLDFGDISQETAYRKFFILNQTGSYSPSSFMLMVN